ncbi:MAG: response regulator transcription factor, partial [Clostridium sp.]|nr:response regulator transcription factor [Clostridium sp.]
MQTILVCDDDKQIVEAIDIYLTGEGFEVIKAYDGYEVLEYLESHDADLLIIDVMMPGLDGIRTTLKVRENSSIPIIILSAKSEDTDKILGLNIGADDYITKPFNPLELVARVKSQLRRYTQLGNLNQQPDGQIYKCGGLQINDDNKEVAVDGETIKLTPIEYN